MINIKRMIIKFMKRCYQKHQREIFLLHYESMERRMSQTQKAIKCPLCSKKFILSSEDYQADYTNCKKCDQEINMEMYRQERKERRWQCFRKEKGI